jgi:DNA-directed RNA polymerase subunit RPC12/RpoP
MSFYSSDKYQMPKFRDCPHCKRSVDSEYTYCPYCGLSLIKLPSDFSFPNNRIYIDPPKIPVIIDPPKIPVVIDRPKIPVINSTIATPQEYCPYCGQRIIRPTIAKIDNDVLKNYPSSSNSSCFIATACNADAETLNTFYNFRDEILLCSPLGKRLVQFYYRFSPGIAKLIQKSEMLQNSILSVLLKPLAAVLRLTILDVEKA